MAERNGFDHFVRLDGAHVFAVLGRAAARRIVLETEVGVIRVDVFRVL